jgi:hypothetical protein
MKNQNKLKQNHNIKSIISRVASILSCLQLVACATPSGSTSAAPTTMGNLGDSVMNAATSFFGGPIANAKAAGGATGSTGAKMYNINGTNIMIDGTRPTDARWQGKALSATPLYHFFDSHPRSSPGEYFPRISITILDYSETLLPNSTEMQYSVASIGESRQNIARPNECIRFNAVIWFNAKRSQKVEQIVHCGTDIRQTDQVLTVGALNNYSMITAPLSISSMQVRTVGPREPTNLLPRDTMADHRLYSTGQHLFQSLFGQMGYRGPLDQDPRVWFVNLAQK